MKLISIIFASEFISLYLIFRIVRSELSGLGKLIAILISVTPIVGPVFYFFIYEMPSSNPRHLQNRGPRGWYTDKWINQRKNCKEIVDILENPEGKSVPASSNEQQKNA